MLKRRIDKLIQNEIKSRVLQLCRIEICHVGETSEQAKTRLNITEHERVIIIEVFSGGASWIMVKNPLVNMERVIIIEALPEVNMARQILNESDISNELE